MTAQEIRKQIENKSRQMTNFKEKAEILSVEISNLEKQYCEIMQASTVQETNNEASHEGIIIFPELVSKEIIDEVENMIKTFVELKEAERLGIRTLAYEIKHNKKGFYYDFRFYTENRNGEITQLEKYFRENDNVLKFITVKLGG